MIAYRIADARHTIFDATGAMLHGGRWNSIGVRVIYAAETYSGALLEVLVHVNAPQPPRNHKVVRIEVPDDISVETVALDDVPGWDGEDASSSRAYGDAWVQAGRSAVLRVPSVITQGRENNLVFNTEHADFGRIRVGAPEGIVWDGRLFSSKK